MKKIRISVLLGAMLSIACVGCGDTIASWDVDNGKYGKAEVITTAEGVDATDMTLHGVVATDGMDGYAWTPFNSASDFQYYEFDITTDGDTNLTATDVTLGVSGDVGTWELRSSTDDYSTIIGSLSDSNDGVFTMDITDMVLTDTTTFRLYGYDNSNLLTKSGVYAQAAINGVPEPASIGLALIGGCVLYGVRRRSKR